MIGGLMGELGGLPITVIQLICVLITMIVTNFCSNTVTATIFVPIVANMVSTIYLYCPSLA